MAPEAASSAVEDLHVSPNRCVAIRGQERGDLERVAFEPRPGGRTRDGRQNEAGQQRNNRQNTNDFDERKPRGPPHGAAIAMCS